MTFKWAPAIASAVRNAAGRLGHLFLMLLLLALSACSSGPSAEQVRRLATSEQVEQARRVTEENLRAVVHAYERKTKLKLGLIRLTDSCSGGQGTIVWPGATGADYKYICVMGITAYFGANPARIGDVLDSVFYAGGDDASPGSPGNIIPFQRDDENKRIVAYYRDHAPNPRGATATEPAKLWSPSQILSWDTVRSVPKKLVKKWDECKWNDPPVSRCVFNPPSMTVENIRQQYGLVFQLEINSIGAYYKVSRDGKVTSS